MAPLMLPLTFACTRRQQTETNLAALAAIVGGADGNTLPNQASRDPSGRVATVAPGQGGLGGSSVGPIGIDLKRVGPFVVDGTAVPLSFDCVKVRLFDTTELRLPVASATLLVAEDLQTGGFSTKLISKLDGSVDVCVPETAKSVHVSIQKPGFESLESEVRSDQGERIFLFQRAK